MEKSLPSWECGLKSITGRSIHAYSQVTPFVGVWIEIERMGLHSRCRRVTPFVGVWIEIFSGEPAEINHWIVTPFVGVWIEMNCGRQLFFIIWSLPSWECGLKSDC